MNLRKRIKESDDFIFKKLRNIYYFFRRFSVPAPKMIWIPILYFLNFCLSSYYWTIRVFWITPLFKSICEKVGKNFNASTFLPFVVGSGRIFIGNNVRVNGKIDFVFGSIREKKPEIHVGNNCGVGHRVMFDISGKLVIGDDCLIARDVNIQDCAGHPLDPVQRLDKLPPNENDVKSVVIGNNVWIGTGVHILPGTKIGDNCVIASQTVVSRRIPSNHIVYSSPFKISKIRHISKYTLKNLKGATDD